MVICSKCGIQQIKIGSMKEIKNAFEELYSTETNKIQRIEYIICDVCKDYNE